MCIKLELAVAEIAAQITSGYLVPGNNLSDDIRGILCRNEAPNRDTELLTRVDALPFPVTAYRWHGFSKDPVADLPIRQQLARIAGVESD